ncbi:MAG: hypothetical protein JW842_07215 [Prolixibacteraceae bacterium]|nr:hypothetical protein [Prolixibacteraceae bacterium]
MKKLRIVLIISALFLMKAALTSAQVSVNVNINAQPLWGPVSYDYVEYYYMPEHNLYYYAPKKQFIYMKGNKWIFSKRLPYQYRHADLYKTYKVVINEPKPYLRNDHYSNYYKQYKQGHYKQDNIRDSRDTKYTKRKDHPYHSHNKAITPKHKNVSQLGNKPYDKNSAKKRGNKQGSR